MRTAVWLVYLALFLLCVWPVQLWILHDPNRPRAARNLRRVLRAWASSLLWLAGCTVEVQGAEHLPEGPVLLLCNHQSYFDIPVLMAALPRTFGFVAKIEVRGLPLLGGWMRLMRCIFIDRSHPGEAMSAMMGDCAAALREGHTICIFPEGRRNRTEDALLPFRRGGFAAAHAASVPILPVVLDGTRDLYERHTPFIRPARVKLRLLTPVATEGLTREQLDALMLRLRDDMEQALADLRKDG